MVPARIGIDPHKRSNTAAVPDRNQKVPAGGGSTTTAPVTRS
jgi:hypothetical protein